MSWLKDFQGGGQDPVPYRDTGGDLNEPRVQDPHIPDRMVRAKPANLPFLAYAFHFISSINIMTGAVLFHRFLKV